MTDEDIEAVAEKTSEKVYNQVLVGVTHKLI